MSGKASGIGDENGEAADRGVGRGEETSYPGFIDVLQLFV
jgi:hypothetical protein